MKKLFILITIVTFTLTLGQLMTNNSRINMGYGLGIVPVKYFETELGNEREHGNYLVLLRTEFTPTQTTTTTATATPVMGQMTIPTLTVTYQTTPETGTVSQPATSTNSSEPASESTNTSGGSKSSTLKGKSSGRPIR